MTRSNVSLRRALALVLLTLAAAACSGGDATAGTAASAPAPTPAPTEGSTSASASAGGAPAPSAPTTAAPPIASTSTAPPTTARPGSTSTATSGPTFTTAPVSTVTAPPPTGRALTGTVTASPTCPVERPDQPCPPRPVAAAHIEVFDASEHLVTSTNADGEGRFTVTVNAGRYRLTASSGTVFPSCPPFTVEVPASGGARADIVCDSGIR